jgi:hypothetical protein
MIKYNSGDNSNTRGFFCLYLHTCVGTQLGRLGHILPFAVSMEGVQ